ncbi:hypothetical protein OQA88_5236 [Cercophora sp. LCS_1]
MADSALDRRLCAATQHQVTEILEKALETTDTASLTAHLLSSVEAGAIPPTVFHAYLPLSRDPRCLAAAIRQTHSASIRREAITKLRKDLRTGPEFRATWAALGGAAGIAALMRELSVSDVESLCRGIAQARPQRDTSAAAEREEAISELFSLVYKRKLDGLDDEPNHPDRDERPLRKTYGQLLSACTANVRDQWRRNEEPSCKATDKVKAPYPDYVEPGQDDKVKAPVQRRNASVRLDGVAWLLNEGNLDKFQADIVEKIDACDAKGLKVDAAKFMEELLLPLAKGVAKWKLVSGARDKAWDTILASLKRWPDLAHELDFEPDGLLSRAIHWWNYVPTEERHLRAGVVLQSLLDLVPTAAFPTLSDFPDILRVKPAHRYELFVWLFRSPKKYGINVESPSDEDREKLKGINGFPYRLFRLLPIDKSINLLNLLAEIRPDKTFLEPEISRYSGLTILSHTPDSTGMTASGDFPLLNSLLLTHLRPKDSGDASSEVQGNTRAILKQRMTKASQSREPSDRLAWAKSVLFLSIASGSLELYANALRWARRFDKDQFTASRLYHNDVLMTKEGLGLLTAIPSNDRLPVVPVATVGANILAANNIVLQILQTAAAAIQEPSYQSRSWSAVGKLANAVTRARFQLVNTFQTYHHLSDDEISRLVWQPTLLMLVEAEKFVLRPEFSRMGLAKLEGQLDSSMLAGTSEVRDHAWQFLDHLAKARDELWSQERVKRYPAVLTLDAPWPKGLPVQSLFHFSFDSTERVLKLPYVLSRAKAVVFGDAKTLRSSPPSDDESRAAISGFVDDYAACLEIYVDSLDDYEGTTRQARVASAWHHATENLTGNWEHARAFWLHFAFDGFKTWIPGLSESESARRSGSGLSFPQPEDPDVPMEWHPDPAAQATEPVERELPGDLSCLECMLSPRQTSTATSPFGNRLTPSKKKVHIPAIPGFWSEERHNSSPPGSTQDVYIAAAMLYINSEVGCGKSLMMQPFPSAKTPRFPALYLADDFLERSTPNSLFDCFRILETFKTRVPPELLLRLARSMLEGLAAADEPDDAHLRLTMDIILLLSRGERPAVACDLIRDVLIDGQGDSSWHRHLFNAGFLSSLPAAEVKGFLNSLTDTMVERLAQTKHHTGSITPSPSVTPYITSGLNSGLAPNLAANLAVSLTVRSRPLIKISTVKMLAQTLRGSTVVDEHITCSILAKILSNARHMDTKIAGIESLVEVFASTKDVKLKERIMDVLRSRVGPIAASLDERYPMTEEDWAKAEADGVVPEIGGMSATDRPLLHLLFRTGLNGEFTPEWEKRWTEGVLLAVLQQSTENNGRWIRLFEKVHGIDRPAGETLPPVPVVARLYNDLIRDRPEFVTIETFAHLRQHVMANIAPPPGIAAVNARIKADAVLGASHGAKHWRALFGNGSIGSLYLGVNTCAALLNRPASIWQTFGENGLTVPLIQDFLLAVADVFIDTSDGRALDQLEGALSKVPSGGGFNRKECREAQIAHALPVLGSIVSRIEGLRTPAWQRDRHRHPRRLPDTFETRLRMLPFPSTSFNDHAEPAPDAEIAAFAAEIISLIDELVRRGRPHHEEWNTLKAAVSRSPVSKSDFLRVAVVLGKGVADPLDPRELTMSDYMRAELTRELIRRGEDPRDRDVMRQTRDLLVLQWKHSHDEVIRERARATIKGLKEAAKSRRDGNQFWAKYEEEWNSALAKSVARWGAKSGRLPKKKNGWGDDSSDGEY